jgi:two-component system alkaline phosphatase synthesis response regulator PhoP
MIASMPARPAGPILVVDDDPKIVALVRTYLERERYPVVTAADGRQALAAIEQLAPRLVVLDLMIPEIDGIAVIRRAREQGDVPILVLSARGSVGDRILGLSEGADDYLPKPFSPAELVVRVKTILRRTERDAVAGQVLVLGDLEVDPDRHEARVGGKPVALSALELRLLAALLDADGRVLGRDRLLDAIHGEGEGDVLDRAIDQYVKRLREKLGDDPAEPRYVATVRGAGYRAAGPVERRATGR